MRCIAENMRGLLKEKDRSVVERSAEGNFPLIERWVDQAA